MSNLNFENIVGFKAVDKDGNEQNVTVDEMVDMVSTRMVMALSETSTFAAAAATGNDVYENELPTVTDAANVRVLQSSGDAAKMTMQSLASKLGELLGINDTWYRRRYGSITDFNEFNKVGYMFVDKVQSLDNKPNTSSNYGFLETIAVNDVTLKQTHVDFQSSFFIRVCNNGTWTDWKQIQTT
uniref:Putative tail fiber protein n=1 Tax=Myoviridae sp. ct04y17 TaxID=2827652 RepID=A0A8S5SIY4_9CAUD|nr:MAG TPA: putative tail fiber protein [Myoviridae sp. ct04y17]